MHGDLFARTTPPTAPTRISKELQALLQPYTAHERLQVLTSALGGATSTGGVIDDKDVSIIRNSAGFTVSWVKAADRTEGATYTYDESGKPVDRHPNSGMKGTRIAFIDSGDIILRQLGKLRKSA